MKKKKNSSDAEPKIKLTEESDRGAVIVGAAMLEARLDEMLVKKIEKQSFSKKHMDRLFDMSGPLSSFSSKTLICRSFDLISAEVFHDLEIVRSLRNRFAHSTEVVDFRSPEIAGIVNSMHAAKRAKAEMTGKTLHVKPTHSKLPAWEMQAKGLLPVAKSTFCASVHHLEIAMLEHELHKLGWKGETSWSKPPPEPAMRLFFVTDQVGAQAIETEGFPQESVTDVEGRALTGVRLTRKPRIRPPLTTKTAVCLGLMFKQSEIEDFGLLADGKPPSDAYWLIPAELLASRPREQMAADILDLIADDDVDTASGT